MDQSTAFKWANWAIVADVIQDNIICRFCILMRLLSYTGTPSINVGAMRLFDDYDIDHMKPSPHYH